MSFMSDVIIVGGGINGTSIAFHLAKLGISVSLVEKSFIAGGPSGRSSAIVRQHYSNRVTAKMALESLRVWQNFTEITGGQQVFTKTGFLVGVRPGDIEALKANIALQQSVGIDTKFLTPQELKEIEPFMDISGLGGAAYEPEAGYCDPAGAANGFAQAARRLGTKIETGRAVTSVRVHGGKVLGVEVGDDFIPAGAVIIAAGPWSKALLEKLGVSLPLITARVKVGLFLRPPEFTHHHIWGDFVTQIYLRPETGGTMLVGSISPEEETIDQVADADYYSEKVEMDILSSFAERIVKRYPLMERSRLHSSYASLYDISPDWHHIMDTVPGYEGLYICAGSSGHGFKLAPSVGHMMAQLVVHGKQPEDEINLFAWDRFAKNQPVKGQYEYSILG